MRFFSIVTFLILVTLLEPKTVLADQLKASGSSAMLVTTKSGVLDREDKRVRLLREFLSSYKSPLSASAYTFVEQADQNRLDWRLLAAIAGVESTFGREIPYNSYNAWGWGIYGTNVISFSSFDEGIQTISIELRATYIDKWGAETVFQIGRYYAASPRWASRVAYFMEKIEQFQIRNPDVALSLAI